MSDAAALEFRVLSGPQAGCRLPLRSGIWRIGSADSCDVLLEGLPPGRTAFLLYVGHQEVAIEAVDSAPVLAGETVKGLTPLQADQVFVLGERLYAVSHPQAAWPENPEPSPPPPPDAAEQTAAVVADPPERLEPTGEPLPSAPAAAPAPAAPAAAAAPPRRSWRPPFWLLWLGGTALFLAVGLALLLVSLQPVATPVPPGPEEIARRLEAAVAATKGHARLQLEKIAEGRWRVRGHVHTRDQKTELARSLRAIDAGIQLQVSADQDLLMLARETLERFSSLGIELVGLEYGALTLRGKVAEAARRDALSKTLFDEVPGLHTIHADISAADDALVALRELLAQAGLLGRLSGRQEGPRLIVGGSPESGERERWRDIRRALESRFGPALEIVENFREAPAPTRSDVVLAVLGPVPYVVLNNGDKEGRRPSEMPVRQP